MSFREVKSSLQQRKAALECKPTQVCLNPSPFYHQAFSCRNTKKAVRPVPRSSLVKCQGMWGHDWAPLLELALWGLHGQLCSSGCRRKLNVNLSSWESKERGTAETGGQEQSESSTVTTSSSWWKPTCWGSAQINGQVHDQSQGAPSPCTHGRPDPKVSAVATSNATRFCHYVFSQEASMVTSKVDTAFSSSQAWVNLDNLVDLLVPQSPHQLSRLSNTYFKDCCPIKWDNI